MRAIQQTRKEVIINIWPNPDDTDHVLVVTIDVDLGKGRKIRMRFVSHHSKISKCSIWRGSVAALWLSRKSKSKTIWTHQFIRWLVTGVVPGKESVPHQWWIQMLEELYQEVDIIRQAAQQEPRQPDWSLLPQHPVGRGNITFGALRPANNARPWA
jgi:hypothetical protein